MATLKFCDTHNMVVYLNKTEGSEGVDIPLFITILVQGLHGEGSTVLVKSHHTPSGDPTFSQPSLSSPSRVPTPPYDSPLPGVESLKTELKLTKQTYGVAFTEHIKKVKKLEKTVKTRQARRRAKIVISDDDMVSKDSSKYRRMIEDIDHDAGVTLVTPIKVSSQEDQPEDQLGVL
nr:hypothetical protein [Tanacetum cinerariifolium]